VKPKADDPIHLHVPLHSRNLEENYSMEIDIPAMDSLEMAGHRIALFARLADEYDLTSLPEKHPARRDFHTLHASSLEAEITF